MPPPQKFKKKFLVQCVQKIFVFRPKGGGIAQCPRPPKYATVIVIRNSFLESEVTAVTFLKRDEIGAVAGGPHFVSSV